MVDLALHERGDGAGLEVLHVAARDREARDALLGDRRVAHGARGELELRERVDEAGVERDRGRAAGELVDLGDRLACWLLAESRSSSSTNCRRCRRRSRRAQERRRWRERRGCGGAWWWSLRRSDVHGHCAPGGGTDASGTATWRLSTSPARRGEAEQADRAERRGVTGDQRGGAEEHLQPQRRAGAAEGEHGGDDHDDPRGRADDPEDAGLAHDRVAREVLDQAGGDRVALGGREAVELLAERSDREALEGQVGDVERGERDQGDAGDGGGPPLEALEQDVHADGDEAEGEDHADVHGLEARRRFTQALPVADHRVQPQQRGEGDRGADEERGPDGGRGRLRSCRQAFRRARPAGHGGRLASRASLGRAGGGASRT